MRREPSADDLARLAAPPLAVGDRVEVEFYRADQESFKYIARIVRRLDT